MGAREKYVGRGGQKGTRGGHGRWLRGCSESLHWGGAVLQRGPAQREKTKLFPATTMDRDDR